MLKKIIRIVFLFLVGLCTTILMFFDLETWLIVNFEADKIPIFGFHNIINTQNQKSSYGLDYTKQDLEKFLEYLVRENYWFLDSNELYDYFLTNSQPIPTEKMGLKAIMLTFDDGYKNINTNVLPILESLDKKFNQKVKVVLFINPKRIKNPKKNNKYISCEELKGGIKQGYYDVQSHGFSHKRLTELNSSELKIELEAAQKALRECTKELDNNQKVAAHLAYAYNDSNSKVENYTSKYYLSGYLYNHQILKLGWGNNNYQLPRIKVDRN
ncbi:MAG: polysaccharide deacetylase family protein, partial [Okeania sp. SIO3I5]|uniref:polysaccharide deacetylase family protein n=1 Tax=Okeania sp. SIO3I5 TaxID=2607805 RepID=UPI0013B6C66E